MLEERSPASRNGRPLESILERGLQVAFEIIESYEDWNPPPWGRASVEALVQAVPERYLVGLSAVVLSNSGALTGRRKRRKVKSSRWTTLGPADVDIRDYH